MLCTKWIFYNKVYNSLTPLCKTTAFNCYLENEWIVTNSTIHSLTITWNHYILLLFTEWIACNRFYKSFTLLYMKWMQLVANLKPTDTITKSCYVPMLCTKWIFCNKVYNSLTPLCKTTAFNCYLENEWIVTNSTTHWRWHYCIKLLH